MRGYTRRRLLAAAAAALAARGSAAPSSSRHGAGPPRPPPLESDAAIVDALIRLVAERPGLAGAARLGRRSAGAPPARPHAAALSRRVLPTAAARREFLAAGDDRRRRIMEVRVAADFEAGRVTVVDGWVLSRTEAALCAVVAASVRDPGV